MENIWKSRSKLKCDKRSQESRKQTFNLLKFMKIIKIRIRKKGKMLQSDSTVYHVANAYSDIWFSYSTFHPPPFFENLVFSVKSSTVSPDFGLAGVITGHATFNNQEDQTEQNEILVTLLMKTFHHYHIQVWFP